MGDEQGSRLPLRCDCKLRPIIAFYGKNSKGHIYIHIATFRNHEPVVQVYSTSSTSVWCRACHRWWNVLIQNDQLSMAERMAHPPIASIKKKPRVLLDKPDPTP